MAGVFGLALIANLVLVAPYLIPRPAAALGTPLELTLMNLDVSNERADLVLAELDRIRPDLVVLLEYTERWAAELEVLRERLPHTVEAPRETPFGMAVFSSRPFIESQVFRLADAGGPAIFVRLEMEDRPIEILAVHAFPPLRAGGTALRDRELAAAARFVRSRNVPVILMGDLNTSYWSYVFRSLTRETGLAPAALGKGLHPTWPTDQVLLRVPIDHVLVPESIGVQDFGRGRFVGSDHFPVRARVGLAPR